MNKKILAIVDTEHQMRIITQSNVSCKILFLRPKYKLSTFFRAIPTIYMNDSLLVGDFRSGYQFLACLIALIFAKKIIISDDGLIGHTLDRMNYKASTLDDGSVSFIKLLMLRPFLTKFNDCKRLSAFPSYTRSLEKKVINFQSKNHKYLTQSKENKLLFIGQSPKTLKMSDDSFVMILERIAEKYSDLDLFYSSHPRSHGIPVPRKWKLVGASDDLKKNNFLYVSTINSTACIDFALSGSKIILADIQEINFTKRLFKENHIHAQDTILEILDFYNKIG